MDLRKYCAQILYLRKSFQIFHQRSHSILIIAGIDVNVSMEYLSKWIWSKGIVHLLKTVTTLSMYNRDYLFIKKSSTLVVLPSCNFLAVGCSRFYFAECEYI